MFEIEIANTWDGLPAAADERLTLAIAREGNLLRVTVDAPYHGDPTPEAPAGRCDGLWDHEVAELFVVGEDERYLELEFGPHDHYLALKLHGPRLVEDDALILDYLASIDGERWTGEAFVPMSMLPPRPSHWNAFAIHGLGNRRRYLAAHPLPGDAPDFHRIDAFPEIPATSPFAVY